MEIATQKPFETKRLLEALQKLQINPLIENISAELSAGARSQSSLLSVNITEADTFNLSLLTDNRRVPSVGSWRRGFLLNEANLFGFGDSVFLNYYNTDGSNAVDFNYTIPFNPHNGTIGITTRFNQTEIIEPPFDRLDITGNSRSYELNVRQPIYHSIYQSISEDFALGLTLSRQESKTELLGKGFPLSRGANEDGDTRISTIRFSQDWTKITPTEVWALRSQFNVGFSALDATHNDFFSWRGQGQYVKVFPSSTSFLIRSNIQLGTELPALEQFGIGGLDSVRGYRQDILLTDNGVFISAELRYPVWEEREIETVLQIVPFIDFGYGWNSSDITVLDTNTLIGVGVGLRLNYKDRLNARFDWGIPLTNIGLEKNTWQENGLYFSVEWQFLK